MEGRYLRNIPAISEDDCRLLRAKKVVVIGCGGLGGHLIELLARVGIGSIRAVDGDVFEESNLNRQLLSEPALLGTSKAEAAAARIRTINPDVKVEAIAQFLHADNAAELLASCDIVLDALDNIAARKVLADACSKAGLPLIYGAISGWVAQTALSLPGDGLIQQLYPENAVIRNKSALSFTPALCAAAQVSLCVRVLLGHTVENGVLHYFDLFTMEAEKIPLL